MTREIVIGGGEDVDGSIERLAGRMETKIAELEKRLEAAEKAKHTCTGDSCHVVDERIDTIRAEMEALRVTSESAAASAQKPRAVRRREEECPECGATFTLPEGVGNGDLVRCGRCRTEWEVGT